MKNDLFLDGRARNRSDSAAGRLSSNFFRINNLPLGFTNFVFYYFYEPPFLFATDVHEAAFS